MCIADNLEAWIAGMIVIGSIIAIAFLIYWEIA